MSYTPVLTEIIDSADVVAIIFAEKSESLLGRAISSKVCWEATQVPFTLMHLYYNHGT